MLRSFVFVLSFQIQTVQLIFLIQFKLTNRTPKTAVNAMLIGSIDSPLCPSAHGSSIAIDPSLSAFTFVNKSKSRLAI